MRGGHEREGDLKSLCLFPILMGIGHLPPAIGALQTMGGKNHWNEMVLLVMMASTTVMVDSLDKYKDLSPKERPRPWVWRLWMATVMSVAGVSTYMCGLSIAIRVHRFLAIGILWGIPCIPSFSPSEGFRILKPKAMIREAKSLIVAICMGYVCTETSMYQACMNVDTTPCPSLAVRQRYLSLVILYQFFRETVCDARDIEEDSKENLNTLPLLLGNRLTLILLLLVGIPADIFLTGGITQSWAGITIVWSLVVTSVMRVTMTMSFFSIILRYPRGNYLAWGSMALFGLLPVLSAQFVLG